MKICHVNLASGYHGGENQTLALIRQQILMGYDLIVVANPKSPLAEAVSQLIISAATPCAMRCRLVLAKTFFHAHQSSIASADRLVHVHEGRAIYWALLQKFLHKSRYIVTRRIDNPLRKKWFAKLAYENADALIGLSEEIVNQLAATYPGRPRYKIPSSPVSYPLNEQEVAAIKHAFSQQFLVMQAANMLHHKGFDVTIAAARLLQTTHPHLHFVLLGDGPLRVELEKLAQDLPNVSFVGKQHNMGDWFKAANVFVHPAYSEGLGSVILEALHSGLPVIGSNTGGIPDIIEHQISGLLVNTGDAQALASAIVQVCQDVDLRQRLIAGGKEKLKLFYIEHTALMYQQIYPLSFCASSQKNV